MRFNQLKKQHDTIVRKKMYKSGKTWVVAAMLSFLGGSVFLTTSPGVVKAATPTETPVESTKTDTQTTRDPQSDVAIPQKIIDEGIKGQGFDGTAPYYMTKAGNLYLLSGKVTVDDTQNIIINYMDTIKKVDTSLAAGPVVAPTDSSGLFAQVGMIQPLDIDLSKLDTSNVTNMSSMFEGSIFKNLNLDSFDTSKVTDMSMMFNGTNCNALNLSKFDTSKVTDMNSMFKLLNNLENYNLCSLTLGKNFNLSSITASDGLENMFDSAKVDKIDFSQIPAKNLENKNVTSITSMFSNINANSVNMGEFNFPNLTDWSELFSTAAITDTLDISDWDMSNLTDGNDDQMFNGLALGKLDSNYNLIPGTGTLIVGSKNKVDSDEFKNIMYDNTVKHEYKLYAPTKIDGKNAEDTPFEVGYTKEGEVVKDVKVPVKADYTAEPETIDIKIGDESNVPTIAYTKIPIMSTYKVSIPTTIDGKSVPDTEVILKDVKLGETKEIDVPKKAGYSVSPEKMSITIGDDSSIKPITYTKIPTNNNHHSSGNSDNNNYQENNSPVNKKQLVSTYPDRGSVMLYKLENNVFNKVSDRALAENSDWYSDEYVDVNNMRYYRVASNEWVKADDVYVYEPDQTSFETKNGFTYLINSHASTVSDRVLASHTDWSVDRIGYLGDYKNPVKAYRVATNEFVKLDNIEKN